MPVPTSPVRPVLATPRRVRTWLPPLGLALAAALAAAGVGLTPDGTELAGRALAPWLFRYGPPPTCDAPWSMWAALVEGRGNEAAADGCAAEIGRSTWRRVVLERVAMRGGPGQAHAARVLLAGATADEGILKELVLGSPASVRRRLLDPTLLARCPLDLAVFAERLPVSGAFDRAVLLRDADPAAALATLGPFAVDLDDEERGWATLSGGEEGPPGSDLGPAPPSPRPPPVARGVFAWVPEVGRDHVFAEWQHLVAFVRRGAERPPAATAELRWARVGESVGRGAPAARVHAVLRGNPAAPPVAAWVLAALAEDAGLAVSARRRDHDIQLLVGGTTLWLGRCGARWVGPPDPGAPELSPAALALEAEALLEREEAAADRAASSPGDPASAAITEPPNACDEATGLPVSP